MRMTRLKEFGGSIFYYFEYYITLSAIVKPDSVLFGAWVMCTRLMDRVYCLKWSFSVDFFFSAVAFCRDHNAESVR